MTETETQTTKTATRRTKTAKTGTTKTTTRSLAVLLSLPALDGAVALAALRGLFRPEHALSLAVLFIAGPAAIFSAAVLKGAARERMLAALLAGIIATLLIIIAAGIGPQLLSLIHIATLQVFGGVAVIMIGIIIIGFKLPSFLPTATMIIGFVAASAASIMLKALA
jgi:hypothetical protein